MTWRTRMRQPYRQTQRIVNRFSCQKCNLHSLVCPPDRDRAMGSCSLLLVPRVDPVQTLFHRRDLEYALHRLDPSYEGDADVSVTTGDVRSDQHPETSRIDESQPSKVSNR